jgi:hypothetical protein
LKDCFGQRGEDDAEVAIQNQMLQEQRQQSTDAGCRDSLEKLPAPRADYQVDAFDHQQDQQADSSGPADELQQNSRQEATGADQILLETGGGSYGEGAEAHRGEQQDEARQECEHVYGTPDASAWRLDHFDPVLVNLREWGPVHPLILS